MKVSTLTKLMLLIELDLKTYNVDFY